MLRSDLPGAEWERMVEQFTATAWRWEQQRVYASDLASGWPDRWQAGDLTPPTHIAQWAATTMAEISASGRTRTRVRLVDEPMTWFQQWADWAGELNRAGGEVIHLMARSRAADLDLIGDPLVDWWLVDDRVVLLLRHDAAGRLLGVDEDTGPAMLDWCRRVRDVARQEVTVPS